MRAAFGRQADAIPCRQGIDLMREVSEAIQAKTGLRIHPNPDIAADAIRGATR